MSSAPEAPLRPSMSLTPRSAINGAIIALCLAAVPQAALAQCEGSTAEAQALICDASGLAEGWAKIDARLSDLKSKHPDLAPALAADQALFTALLEKTAQDLLAEHPAAEVPAILLTGLEDRHAFLSALEPLAETGLSGSWQNAAGGLRITGDEAGEMSLRLSVSEPIMGLRTCSVDGTGKLAAGLLSVTLPPSDEISLSQAGQSALLGVDYTRAGRAAEGPMHCSEGPPVSGWYFRVKERA